MELDIDLNSIPIIVPEEEDDPLFFDDFLGDLEEFLFSDDTTSNLPEDIAARKRKRNELAWKSYQRKLKREAGEEYVSSRGKIVQAKTLMAAQKCLSNCKYNCNAIIDDNMRKEIFSDFYRLPTNGKYQYILNTTDQMPLNNPFKAFHKKQCSYMFWFFIDEVAVNVCKMFYLSTLNINQKVVYGVHEKKDKITNAAKEDGRGKHGKQKKMCDDARTLVMEHIKSFPIIKCHFSRYQTHRQLLDPSLTISKMHQLYEELCESAGIAPLNMKRYSKIFNEDFSLSFLVPKRKRCNICLEFDVATKENNVSDELKERYKTHEIEKNVMVKDREYERKKGDAVLCFDIQNVICCPKADESSFYYKTKMNVYLLTAHFSKANQVFCVLWNEILGNEAGNDLASAIRLLLNKVYESNREMRTITIWSDSCLPNNKTRIMAYAILDFLRENKKIKYITLKYGNQGHTGIIEVYNVQSGIDKLLVSNDFYSPIALIEMLKTLRRKKPYNIIQLTKEDMRNYGENATLLNYDTVPFDQAVYIKITNSFNIDYKVKYNGDWLKADITPPPGSLALCGGVLKIISSPKELPEVKLMGLPKNFPQEKIESIRSMYEKMPEADKEYFEYWFTEIDVVEISTFSFDEIQP